MFNNHISKRGVIFLAGGKGLRFSSKTLKQFIPFKGKPLALHAFDVFLKNPCIEEIVVVCQEKYQKIFPKDKRIIFALPGNLRQDSVISGFKKLSPLINWIYTHDSVRPFINQNMLTQLYKEGKEFGAASFASPIHYTIKKISSQKLVIETLERSNLYITHTPQLLSRQIFEVGIKKIIKENLIITDDVSLAEIIRHPVKIIPDLNTNIKITLPNDLKLAEALYDQYEQI